ncbi:MAG: EamA family transporter [Candidatus Lokiarchaeota archaeon]|nr:EamA family transporter [Candidatus Lokiarchaeota archaeon]MBD3338022.1 EamA family transporter [Candidatus Lokiarchaeota archaeon]
MVDEKYIKGVVFALISLFLVSMQPIVAISRPKVLDAYLFAAMTCIVMALFMFPLIIAERHKYSNLSKKNPAKSDEYRSILNGWKKHKRILIYVGINFAVAQVIFFLAYELAGAINGSLAQQTTIIFALLFGFLIHHEKVTKIQIVFSIILLFGLTFAITQGSFNLLEFNLGVLLMLMTAAIWMLAHTFTKPILEKNESTAIQIVFIRNIISGSLLFSTYFIFFPITNILLLLEPINVFFFIAMGFFYVFDILFWYKSLTNIELSKASVLVSPMPILTAIFAFLILGELLTIHHLIGAFIIIISIIIIVRKKKEDSFVSEKL